MYVVYINLLYFLSIFLFTYNKKSSFPKKTKWFKQSTFYIRGTLRKFS